LESDLIEARKLETAATGLTQRLTSAQQTLEQERGRIDALKLERQRHLAELEKESKDKKTELSHLREDAQQLQQVLANLQRNSAPTPAPRSTEGNLGADQKSQPHSDWPVTGNLRHRFGAARMSGQWDGVVISAPEGEAVHAIKPGRVAFADWLRGYGLLAIVDHGNGLMSLYGFNQSIHKIVGDWVGAGDVVASVGSSGGQSEPALYFGIRDKGRPIDPLTWRAHQN
jgi:septal ring factor EnvC (AmiA/AmiB activator)